MNVKTEEANVKTNKHTKLSLPWEERNKVGLAIVNNACGVKYGDHIDGDSDGDCNVIDEDNGYHQRRRLYIVALVVAVVVIISTTITMLLTGGQQK